jgi:hypothetical protein
MTTPQLDPLRSTDGVGTDALAMPDPDSLDAAVTRASAAAAGIRTGVSAVRRGVLGLLARMPATARATRTAARETVGALQTLPDDTLRSLAATSVGLGVGLSFTRARRLAFVVGMVPAALIGAAIVARPVEPLVPADAGA